MKTSRCATIAVVLLASGVWRLNAQTTVDLTRQGKLGTGTIVPSQCAVGQVFFKTGAHRLYDQRFGDIDRRTDPLRSGHSFFRIDLLVCLHGH